MLVTVFIIQIRLLVLNIEVLVTDDWLNSSSSSWRHFTVLARDYLWLGILKHGFGFFVSLVKVITINIKLVLLIFRFIFNHGGVVHSPNNCSIWRSTDHLSIVMDEVLFSHCSLKEIFLR